VSLSQHARQAIVNHIFKEAYTPVTPLYLCLCTAHPSYYDTGSTITETVYTNYTRKLISSSFFGAASSRKVVQASDAVFATSESGDPSTIKSYAICDASSSGNLLAYGNFSSEWELTSGTTPKIVAGEIEIVISNAVTTGITNFTAHKILDMLFRNVAWTSPKDNLYFGLTTATISDGSTMSTITECSGNSYARKNVLSSAINYADDSSNTSNNAVIAFVTPTGTWGLVTSMFATTDASGTAGDLLFFDNTNIVDCTPDSGDTIQFLISDFEFRTYSTG